MTFIEDNMSVVGKILSHPRVFNWLVKRSEKAPYIHLTDETTGDVYMKRFWLFNPYNPAQKKKWLDWVPSIRLHHIMREDRDRHLHDHPWNARTFILKGWYIEERPSSLVWITPSGNPLTRFALKSRGDTGTIKFGEYHRISSVSPDGVWTMFITYKYRGTWGFLVDGVKVKYREYLGIK